MRYDIKIMGKEECTAYSLRKLNLNCIIISINDSGYNTIIHENLKIIDVLTLEFDDIGIPIENLKLMTMDDGYKIKNFIDKYKDSINNIVVHCTAGISRSAAVACCLARYLNGDDTYLFEIGKYIPNKFVYKCLCNALNIDYDEESFEEKQLLSGKYLDGDTNLIKIV